MSQRSYCFLIQEVNNKTESVSFLWEAWATILFCSSEHPLISFTVTDLCWWWAFAFDKIQHLSLLYKQVHPMRSCDGEKTRNESIEIYTAILQYWIVFFSFLQYKFGGSLSLSRSLCAVLYVSIIFAVGFLPSSPWLRLFPLFHKIQLPNCWWRQW